MKQPNSSSCRISAPETQATTLDLSGVTLSEGPREPFVIPQGVQLAPGQYVVLVRDVQAFRAAYPNVDPGRILGEYDGNLSNQGERIKLDDAQGNTIVDFEFGANDPWADRADGVGRFAGPDRPGRYAARTNGQVLSLAGQYRSRRLASCRRGSRDWDRRQ